MVTQVTDATFEKEVLGSEVPVLVDYWAEWCGPCKMISPMLEETAAAYSGRLQLAKLNVDDAARPGTLGLPPKSRGWPVTRGLRFSSPIAPGSIPF